MERRLTSTLAKRQPLADRSRSARYARQQVRSRIASLLRLTWKHLLVATVFVLGGIAGVAFQSTGVLRGFVLGAGVVAYLALVGLGALLLSGGASSLSGAMAESSTATELAALCKRGWHVVQGLKIDPRSDIDHVAIGPSGVLVVETKWSSEPWPSSVDGRGYMNERLRRAIDQTIRSRTLVIGGLGDRSKRPGVTRAVLVLDSPPIGERWLPYEHGGVDVVRYGDLGKWLGTLTDGVLQPDDVQAVAARASELVERYEVRADADPVFTPTITQLMTRWLVVGPLALIAFLAGLTSAAAAYGWWGYFLGLGATTAVWWKTRASQRWRPVLFASVAAEVVLSTVVLISLIRWVVSL